MTDKLKKNLCAHAIQTTMISDSGCAAANHTDYTITLAWQDGGKQVVTLSPHSTIPLPCNETTAALFAGGAVTGVVVGVGKFDVPQGLTSTSIAQGRIVFTRTQTPSRRVVFHYLHDGVPVTPAGSPPPPVVCVSTQTWIAAVAFVIALLFAIAACVCGAGWAEAACKLRKRGHG